MSILRIARARMILAASAALSACSAATEVPPIQHPASFEARITGGVDRTLHGGAQFSNDAVGDGYGFAIRLVDPVAPGALDAARHAIYFHRMQPGGRATGEFRVIESRDLPDASATDFVGQVVIDANETNGLVCHATAGTIRLTQLGNGHLRGDFAVSARCARTSGPGTDDPIELTGSFEAEDGIVAIPEIPEPAAGSYTLVEAGGQPLPGIVSVGVDEGQWFEVIATSGRISIDATGHYEQLVMLQGWTDGKLTSRWRWVDRGTCRRVSGARFSCISEYFQNVQFGATVNPLGIETVQDVVGDGVGVRFRYRRSGPS